MGILHQIRDAGIVGCGGAGFPTHKKLGKNIEYFIVNGAECEPLLRTDRYLMLHRAPDLVRAIMALKTELNIAHCVIALKHHYQAEAQALRQAIQAAGAEITVHELESFYPAGDEQTIVYEVTGRVVPPAGIPMAVGAVVNNVATVCAIAEAMDGLPFTQKYLTVTGDVRCPTILQVPVGTSYQDCLALAGGPLARDYFIVNGGPMMGKPVTKEEASRAVVTKTTSGILVLPAGGYHARTSAVDLDRMLQQARSACIQCTACTQLCPRHMLGHPLQPHRIMRALSAPGGSWEELLQDPVIRNAQLCCECGICETYACPMSLFPRKINSMLKGKLGAAGIRYQPPEGVRWEASPHREYRKAPSERVAARAGVRAYYDYEISQCQVATPERVEIPLQMHIGPPSVPLVSPGDQVAVGTLIAQPPEGAAMGARIHASLAGRVASVGERIVIVKE